MYARNRFGFGFTLLAVPMALACPVAAQDASDQADSASPTVLVEELVVTGTRIVGQEGTSAPLIQFDTAALEQNPTSTLSEFFRENLTAMTAFPNDVEERSQGPQRSNGNRVSGVNLWNLGEHNTLTLLDGSRLIKFAAPNGAGWYTTDVNAILPGIAMSRADILLDGGGAIYGTDAIGGVVNLVPRYGFEGLEVRAQTDLYPEETLSKTGSNILSVLFGSGFGDGRGSLIVAGEFSAIHRNDAAELGLSNVFDAPDTTGVALDGAAYDDLAENYNLQTGGRGGNGFEWVAGSGRGATTLTEPLCGASIEGVPFYYTGLVVPDGATTATPGTCTGYGAAGTPAGPTTQVRDNSSRNSLFTALRYEFSNAVSGSVNVSYNDRENLELFRHNQADGSVGTNFNALVPPDHPAVGYYKSIDSVWNRALTPGRRGGAPSLSGGETFGIDHEEESSMESTTVNVHGALDWTLNNRADLRLGTFYGKSEVDFHRYSLFIDRYQDALNGFGGPNCNPANGTAGVGDCMYFNPFISSLLPDASTVWAGGSLANDSAVVDWMGSVEAIGRFFNTEIQGIDLALTVDTGLELAGGGVFVVLGGEHRQEEASVDYNEFTQTTGLLASQPQGQIPYAGSDDINALFLETALPLTDRLDVQIAGRYDDYASVGSTFNPKFGFNFRPADRLTFRGSWGTSLTTPSIAHSTLTQNGAPLSTDAVNTQGRGAARGNSTKQIVNNTEALPGLGPQEATHYSVGVDATLWESLGALNRMTVSVSYIDIDFTDRIARVTARNRTSALGNNLCGTLVRDRPGPPANVLDWGNFYLTEDVDLDGAPDGGVRCWEGVDANNDGIIDGGYDGVTGEYSLYSNLDTSTLKGLNFAVNSNWNTGLGRLSAGINGTYTLEAIVPAANVQGALVDSVGFTGLNNATPQIREWVVIVPITLNWGTSWLDGHSTRLLARHDSDIEQYTTGIVNSGGVTTWDLRHNFQIMDSLSAALTVRNLTGKERLDPTPNVGAGDRRYFLQLNYSPVSGER